MSKYDPEKRRKYYLENKEAAAKQNKEWKAANKDKVDKANLKSHLKTVFKLSLEQHETMLKEQNYCCAVCNKHQDDCKYLLDIDHDHNTNEIRGLLCRSCNMGLGYFKDNSELLFKAASYLISYKKEV